jgi:hypothetical protein
MTMVQAAQRVGRYAYRKVKVAVTNPAHYIPSAGNGSKSKLGLDNRYRDGKVDSATDPHPKEG